MRAAWTASASEVDITSPVTLRVGPARTREMMALCGICGLDTEPEDAVPLDSCVETCGCTDVEARTSLYRDRDRDRDTRLGE